MLLFGIGILWQPTRVFASPQNTSEQSKNISFANSPEKTEIVQSKSAMYEIRKKNIRNSVCGAENCIPFRLYLWWHMTRETSSHTLSTPMCFELNNYSATIKIQSLWKFMQNARKKSPQRRKNFDELLFAYERWCFFSEKKCQSQNTFSALL